jgi:hypothetical protein
VYAAKSYVRTSGLSLDSLAERLSLKRRLSSDPISGADHTAFKIAVGTARTRTMKRRPPGAGRAGPPKRRPLVTWGFWQALRNVAPPRQTNGIGLVTMHAEGPETRRFLCFYADGPFRDNLVRAAAYPSGYSYFRPFRYRDEWIQPQLLDAITQDDWREALGGTSVVLAARFQTQSDTWTVLPIRKATISHVRPTPDLRLIYFTLGAFVDFRTEERLEDLAVRVPEHEQEGVQRTLFFESTGDVPDFAPKDADEDALWVRYTQLIVESSLPFADDSRRSVFPRFLTPLKKRGPAKVTQLYSSALTGPTHGAMLHEGSAYEFGYFHRTPGLVATNTGFQRFRIQHLASTGNIELERADDEATAHYQFHTLQLGAARVSVRGEDLVLRADKETVPTDAGDPLMTHDTQIPMRIRRSIVFRFRTRWSYLLLLFLAFMAVSAWNLAQQAPDRSFLDLLPDAIPGGALGALVWFVQQRVSRG